MGKNKKKESEEKVWNKPKEEEKLRQGEMESELEGKEKKAEGLQNRNEGGEDHRAIFKNFPGTRERKREAVRS